MTDEPARQIKLDDKLLWTADDVALLLGVTEHSVKNQYRVRALRGVLMGRHLRFRPSDVRDYIDSLGDQ